MAFLIGPYRAVEHLRLSGSGHRISPFWRGEDVRSVEDVALTVLPVESSQIVRDEVDVAEGIRHPHLLPVTDVVEDDIRVAIVCPWPRGGRLIELVRRRGVLSVGETVTVLLPVAAALAQVHRAGVRHAGVCAEAIWFDTRGRPLLGAAAVGSAVADIAGPSAMACGDLAPDVLRQARSGPPGPPADVFSLGSVALFCLTGRSAWPADEPTDVLVQSAAGQWPDLPDEAGPAELVGVVRSMLAADPADRPDADMVVGALTAVAARTGPEPIRFAAGPVPTPASSKRWRGWADRMPAAEADPAGTAAGSVGSADASGDPAADVVDPADLAEPIPVGEWDADGQGPGGITAADDESRRRLGPAARLAVAVLSGLLLTVLVAQVANWVGEDTTAASAEHSAAEWEQVVTSLDVARSEALAAGDPALLDRVYAAGSPAAAADAATIDGLAANGWRVVDGRHDIVSVRVLNSDDRRTRLEVVDTLAARPVLDAAGQQVATTVARGEERRVVVVDTTDDGYRISAIEPG